MNKLQRLREQQNKEKVENKGVFIVVVVVVIVFFLCFDDLYFYLFLLFLDVLDDPLLLFPQAPFHSAP